MPWPDILTQLRPVYGRPTHVSLWPLPDARRCPESVFIRARKDAVLPLSEPIRGIDGTYIESIFVPKGTHVSLGVLAINRDPLLWGDDANEWNPERWLKPLPKQLTEARVFGAYSHLYVHFTTLLHGIHELIVYSMTFLGGSRGCIGFKFAEMEMSKSSVRIGNLRPFI